MMYSSTAFIFIVSFLVLLSLEWSEATFKERDKVLYKDLGTLYFSPGEKTRARRTYSVPQLVCLHGCHHPQPRQVQCTNTGWDGSSNLWKCKAELDSKYVLDRPEVVCEGYNSPDDAFVTVGSCSLEYSIKPRNKADIGGSTNLMSIFFFVFCAFLMFVLYKTCLRPDNERIHQNSFTNDNGPDDGQGPQMGWNIPGMNQRHRANAPGYGNAPRDDTCGNQGNMGGGGRGGGGGFWTGLATGGLLGYMMGGNQNRNTGYGYSGMGSPGYGLGGGYAPRGSSGLFSSGNEESSSTSESVSTARYRQR